MVGISDFMALSILYPGIVRPAAVVQVLFQRQPKRDPDRGHFSIAGQGLTGGRKPLAFSR